VAKRKKNNRNRKQAYRDRCEILRRKNKANHYCLSDESEMVMFLAKNNFDVSGLKLDQIEVKTFIY